MSPIPVDSGIPATVSLANAIYDSPGVYAVLIGSGLSTAAGIPTGWEVARELVRRVATLEGTDLAGDGIDPETWWRNTRNRDVSYSEIVEMLSGTELERRSLIRRFFDPGPENSFGPTDAHRALARLCADGLVRVILTTNFDPLIERALDEVGLTPQVISSPSQVKGMTPLRHAAVTVVKVHGDYVAPGLKNTPIELASFAPPIRRLVAEVLDQYGLLVVGWSAEYDTALRTEVEKVRARRYPMYWATYRGQRSEAAKRLIAQQGARSFDTAGADQFLPALVERIAEVERRATRRQDVRMTRAHVIVPNTNVITDGWSKVPRLVLRTAAVISPATDDTTGLIGPEQREVFQEALEDTTFTETLRKLASSPFYRIDGARPSSTAQSLGVWSPVLGIRQSTEFAIFRLSGDIADCSISALSRLALPMYSALAGGATITLDIGLQDERRLFWEDAAELFRDGLVAVTSELPNAIADLLPSDATATHCEMHFMASRNDGFEQRQNSLEQRLSLDLLRSYGEGEGDLGDQNGFAANLSGGLTANDTGELVAFGMNYMALSSSFLDPRQANASVRRRLRLPVVSG